MLRACRLAGAVLAAAATTVLAMPAHAYASGAAIAPYGAQATMNRELALVHWDGTTETIVMQPALDASSNDVALVVPTPMPAAVAAVDKSTLTELNEISAPQIEGRRHWTLRLGVGDPAPEAAPGAPLVVSQVDLGPLEATTLVGGDLAGLRNWLADNNYAIQPEVSDALGPYVQDRWSFMAMRLTSKAPIVGGLDPVRLTFGSPQMVYPMRLSVAGPRQQRVTIFTLADHRQQRVDADVHAQSVYTQYAGRISGGLQNPLLRELAGGRGSYLTKIAVEIADPSRITSDFAFGDAPNDDAYRQVLVVNDDIVIPLVAIVFVLFVFEILVAVVLLRRRRRRKAAVIRRQRRNSTM